MTPGAAVAAVVAWQSRPASPSNHLAPAASQNGRSAPRQPEDAPLVQVMASCQRSNDEEEQQRNGLRVVHGRATAAVIDDFGAKSTLNYQLL